VAQFFPERGYGKLQPRVARKATSDYRKATGDLAGTAELMLTYVEQGMQFTLQYGDIDAPFYSGLESVLVELTTLLGTTAGTPLYPHFAGRLRALAQSAAQMGWGYGDAESALGTIAVTGARSSNRFTR
jgi:hypothetical protein